MQFSWVKQQTTKIAALRVKHKLDWYAECFHDAATGLDCDAAEKRLGIILPPSLREFYLYHNGGQFSWYYIYSVDELCRYTEQFRQENNDYEGAADKFLDIVAIRHGNEYLLDSAHRSLDGEYPVCFASRELGPTEWMRSVRAQSFGSWLKSLFDDIVLNNTDPLMRNTFLDAI